MNLWPHQPKAVADVHAAIAEGVRRTLVTSPTGGGKTRIMGLLANDYVSQGRKVVLYTNRKLLVSQTSGVFSGFDIEHGVRSAGHEENMARLVQVSSIQTEHSRVMKRKEWTLHDAAIVLVDEAHLIKADVAQAIFDEHVKGGACIVGFTATPLDLEGVYDRLIVAGTPSQLRDCNALVRCDHFGPDEPDLAAIKKQGKKIPEDGNDLTEKQQISAMMNPTLFGRVWESFEKLNPERKPTILFGPGTKESLWFAEKFWGQGVSAAHVAAGQVWMNGEWLPTKTAEEEQESRQRVLAASKSGKCTVLCNRFLLREGIDAPHLQHGILATIFGSLQSYLQSGGRLLRSHPGKEKAVIQDHGGNWWRHGSLNADREWDLSYSAGMVYGLRAEKMRDKKTKEPWSCPKCRQIMSGSTCVCGYKPTTRSRPVVTTEGNLKQMTGDIFRTRRVDQSPTGKQKWAKMYFRSLKGKGIKTFAQARALYAYENNWGWPDKSWSFMPIDDRDIYRLVPDVPRERLR